MNQRQIQQLRQKLVQQREEINALEATLQESSQIVELDQAKVGRLSRMDAMQGQQMALEASRRRRQQLVNIQRALTRMENDEYGYCLECGEAIDFRRLEFDPASSHCIHCAE